MFFGFVFALFLKFILKLKPQVFFFFFFIFEAEIPAHSQVFYKIQGIVFVGHVSGGKNQCIK